MDSNKKDTDVSIYSQESKNSIVLKLFEKDSQILFVYKKLERVVSALFLITNFLSDSEPIKWQLRTISMDLISETLSSSSNPLSRSEAINKMALGIVKLLSFLDIAYVAGLVSEMNFSVLKKELGYLAEIVNTEFVSAQTQAGKDVIFDKEFFAVPAEQLRNSISVNNLGQISGVVFPAEQSSRTSNVLESEPNSQKKNSKGQNYIKDRIYSGINKRQEPVAVQKNFVDRQDAIIKLLKTKSNLTIKDFTSVIKGCSDKTIQRELLKMVKLNVLKKEGERRWSRYSIV